MGDRGRAGSSAAMTSRRGKLIVLSAAAAAGALQLLASVGTPVGIYEDDALHLRIARAVLGGARAFPFDPHVPVLPGLGLLLALPVRLLEPHWALFRAVGLLSVGAAFFFTRRLARRALPEDWASAAALLAALSPVALGFAGAVLPDLPLMALCAALFDALAAAPRENARSRSGVLALMAAGACAASLLRPQGAILAACVGLGVFMKYGARRGALFTTLSLLPLAGWLAFNHFAAGTISSYYSSYWRSQVAGLAGSEAGLVHAARLLTAIFADALFPVARLPFALRLAAGLAGLVLACLGLSEGLRRSREPWIFAAGVYGVAILALHLTWQPVEARYAMPLLPLLLVFILRAVHDRAGGRPPLSAALPAFFAAAALASGAVLALSRCRAPSAFQPETMKWLRENTPPDARVESLEYNAVALLAERDAVFPATAGTRDAWLAAALAGQEGFLHVVPDFAAAAVSLKPHPAAALLPSQLPLWARSSPYIKEVYADPAEGTVVFRLDHPDAARFLRAWSEYQIAGAAARGGHLGFARGRLRRAVELEPELASAWAALGSIEPEPALRRNDFERAARADPTSAEIRRDLAAERAARRDRR